MMIFLRLGMVILIGAELFTGYCLIMISALDRKASAAGVSSALCK